MVPVVCDRWWIRDKNDAEQFFKKMWKLLKGQEKTDVMSAVQKAIEGQQPGFTEASDVARFEIKNGLPAVVASSPAAAAYIVTVSLLSQGVDVILCQYCSRPAVRRRLDQKFCSARCSSIYYAYLSREKKKQD